MPLHLGYTSGNETDVFQQNFVATSATPGTSVTPGASNAEGTFTQIFTQQTADSLGIYLRVSDGATSTAAKPQLLDLGIDPAGGTSYGAIINNIVCGASAAMTASGAGQRFFFPLRIPSGSTVAVRIQGANATAGTVRIGARLYQGQSRPWGIPVGQYAETVGTITNSNGVSFTPGNNVDGTWVSLGTTSQDLWWWQLCYQVDNGTITAETARIDLGAGTTGNQRVIQSRFHVGTTGETCGDPFSWNLIWHEGFHPIPAGTEMWIRGRCENAPDTGYNGVAIGIGG